MVKFEGFDKNGEVIFSTCKTHNFFDLPMKGLGKSLGGVGIDEPVIIPQSAREDKILLGYTLAEIERRADELKAEIRWKELPAQSLSDEQKTQMWFCNSGLRE